MNHTIRTVTLLLATLGLAGLAQAQQQVFKFGATRYQTHASTNGVTGPGLPAGADASVGSATTALFTYEYEFMPNIGAELVIGVPPRIKGYAAGSVSFLGEVVEAKLLAPTLLLNYHFGQPGDALRPYIGAGIGYTKFTSVSSPYGWQVDLSDTWAPTAQIGLDYAINKQWGVYGSVAVARVKSDLVAVSGTVLQTTINFKPVIYSLGVAFHF
jgi:outer membrane protein